MSPEMSSIAASTNVFMAVGNVHILYKLTSVLLKTLGDFALSKRSKSLSLNCCLKTRCQGRNAQLKPSPFAKVRSCFHSNWTFA